MEPISDLEKLLSSIETQINTSNIQKIKPNDLIIEDLEFLEDKAFS